MIRAIKNIMYKLFYTCDQATLLIEKKASAESLTFVENMRLEMHLVMCKFCNAYSKKVKIIDRTLIRLSQKEQDSLEKYEELQFKNELKEKIRSND